MLILRFLGDAIGADTHTLPGPGPDRGFNLPGPLLAAGEPSEAEVQVISTFYFYFAGLIRFLRDVDPGGFGK